MKTTEAIKKMNNFQDNCLEQEEKENKCSHDLIPLFMEEIGFGLTIIYECRFCGKMFWSRGKYIEHISAT